MIQRKRALVVSVPLAVVAALVACSGSIGTTEATGGVASTDCNASAVFAQGAAAGNACAQCLEDGCKSQLDAYGTGCGDFIQCVCTAGAAARSCSPKAQEQSCLSASEPLALCINSKCRLPCDLGPLDGGPGG